jgi:hypothetical protein
VLSLSHDCEARRPDAADAMHAEPSLLRGRGAVLLNRDVLAQG